MPLPDNAVDNAVAKLDGIADELMKKSGIPGMAVAVVHGGKTVYAKGFGVKDVRNGADPANRVDPDTVFQLASLSKPLGCDRRRPSGRCRCDRLGHPDRRPSCRGSRWRTRLSRKMVTRRRHVLAPLRACPTTQATCSRTSATTGATSSTTSGSCPSIRSEFPTPTPTSGFTAGAEARRAEAGKTWEDLSQEVAVRAAGHDVDKLAVRRLRGQAGPRRRPHPRRRGLQAALRPRRRRPRRLRAGSARR